jgi:hypothetical protein
MILGFVSFYIQEGHRKELKKFKRKTIDRDYWDFLLWKIGIGLGFCGLIGVIIEFIKLMLNL